MSYYLQDFCIWKCNRSAIFNIISNLLPTQPIRLPVSLILVNGIPTYLVAKDSPQDDFSFSLILSLSNPLANPIDFTSKTELRLDHCSSYPLLPFESKPWGVFFFLLWKISPELTTTNPPLFAEEDWPWANIHAHLPLLYMWDAYTAWLAKQCHVHARHPNWWTWATEAERAHITTAPATWTLLRWLFF